MDQKLYDDFSAALGAFLKRREKGGILLPNECIVDEAYWEALYNSGIKKRPEPRKPIHIFRKKDETHV